MWWLSWLRYELGLPATVRVKAYREDLVHYGSVYMRRWVLRVRPGGHGSDGGFEVRLHHTIKPDGVQDHLHDHPWGFVTMLLWGSYTHLVQAEPPKSPIRIVRRWLPGSIARIPHGMAHVIIDVGRNGAWTLCVTGPKREHPQWRDEASDATSPSFAVQGSRQQSWGFWVDGTWVSAREYFSEHPDSEEFIANTKTYFDLYLIGRG